jgi:hypothetical protein
MNATCAENSGDRDRIQHLDGEMTELVLLLPGWQAAALERAAQQRGLTGGQLTRRLIATFLNDTSIPRPFA